MRRQSIILMAETRAGTAAGQTVVAGELRHRFVDGYAPSHLETSRRRPVRILSGRRHRCCEFPEPAERHGRPKVDVKSRRLRMRATAHSVAGPIFEARIAAAASSHRTQAARDSPPSRPPESSARLKITSSSEKSLRSLFASRGPATRHCFRRRRAFAFPGHDFAVRVNRPPHIIPFPNHPDR